MSDNDTTVDELPEGEEAAPVAPPTPPRRGPGHRGQDVRDTMAEMAARAHEISLEAGSKMASAMRDVIGAAAGLTAFAIESARDLLQYMVRRGQMTQDEADKLLREVEHAHGIVPKTVLATPVPPPAPRRPPPAEPEGEGAHAAAKVKASDKGEGAKGAKKAAPPAAKKAAPPAKAGAKPAAKAPAKAAPAKVPAKAPAKAVAKKPAAKKR